MLKRTLIIAGAIELAIEVAHALGPRAEHAAHLRVLTGLTAGNESLLAHFTGNLSFMLQLTLLIGAGLLWMERRKRAQAAADAVVKVAGSSAP